MEVKIKREREFAALLCSEETRGGVKEESNTLAYSILQRVNKLISSKQTKKSFQLATEKENRVSVDSRRLSFQRFKCFLIFSFPLLMPAQQPTEYGGFENIRRC